MRFQLSAFEVVSKKKDNAMKYKTTVLKATSNSYMAILMDCITMYSGFLLFWLQGTALYTQNF